ncbi:hypothetical protein LPJ70_003382, partial [Coemansia sp. RSA 2708]
PSPDHFAEAIARVLAAPVDQRRAMGDAGRARVLQHFSLDAYADKLEALFETMFEYPPAVSAVLGVLMTLFIVGTSAVVILVLVLVS